MAKSSGPSAGDVSLRPAIPEDAWAGGRLLFESFPQQATFLIGLGNADLAKEILTELFALPGHRFSYDLGTVALVKGRVAGLLIGCPGRELRNRDSALARLILGKYRLRGKLALILRAWPLIFIQEADRGSFLVGNLAVKNRLRGRGIGSRLLAHAEIQAEEGGYQQMALMVDILNKGAEALYVRHGYRVQAIHLESNSRVAHLGPGYKKMVKTLKQ
jgi:ribosomal protein S18 acetylase RimI-like enzyme